MRKTDFRFREVEMIYLDNAATSRKKPFGVYFALFTENLLSANPGRGGHRASLRTALKIEKVRDKIRDLFFDGDVVFTKNCTEALNLAFSAAPKGKKVIATTSAHTSVLRPLKRLFTQGKIILKVVPSDFDSVLKEVDRDTGMVVLGAVSNVTGERTEVERILKSVKEKSRAVTVVDGAQSAGNVDFDFTDADLSASSGHKGLHGAQGTGFLIVKRGIKLSPLIVGGTGNSSFEIDIPDDVPGGMEAGTVNAPGIIALGKGIDYTVRNKKRLIRKEKRMTEYLEKKLSSLSGIKVYSARNGIILFNAEGVSCGEVADELSDRYGIYVRSGLHCAPLIHKELGTAPDGAVRVSVGNNNRFWHLYYFLFAVKKILQRANEKESASIS